MLDWGEHDGLLYYVMELVEGRDAAALAPLPPRDVVEIVRAIAAALGLLDARAALFARCFRSGWQEAFIYAPTAPALKDAGLVAQLRADVAMLHDLDVPPGPWREIIRRTVPALLCLAEEAWDRAAELAREAQSVARDQAGGSVLYLARALAAEAEAHLGMGQPREADDRLRDVIAMVVDPRSNDPPLGVRAHLDRARAALAEADRDRAGQLQDEVARRLETVDLPGEQAAHRHLAGERALATGDLAAAATHARAAQEAFVRLGNPLAAERALRLRRRSGDPAQEPLARSATRKSPPRERPSR